MEVVISNPCNKCREKKEAHFLQGREKPIQVDTTSMDKDKKHMDMLQFLKILLYTMEAMQQQDMVVTHKSNNSHNRSTHHRAGDMREKLSKSSDLRASADQM